MKKVFVIFVALALLAGAALLFFTNPDRIIIEINLESDDSPFMNDIYSIDQLSVIDGDIIESSLEGSQLFILEELPGEDNYSLELPTIEVGDKFYRLVLKNTFITDDERLKENYRAYIWSFDEETEGGYPILELEAM